MSVMEVREIRAMWRAVAEPVPVEALRVAVDAAREAVAEPTWPFEPGAGGRGAGPGR